MRRRRFVTIAAALAALPRAARATGGLEIEAARSTRVMRVLLATGTFAPPEAIDEWHFAWDGRTFRGSFASVTLDDGRTGLVNTLRLDAYLYGVLAKEISPGWPQAAQRAQAIVSRTYALTKARPHQPYDVLATQSDQQYGGIEGESEQGRAAIDATAATIVTYAGMPARVAYGACCGGRTADAGDVWNTPLPYLQSIDDPNCAGSPAYAWQATIALRDVTAALPGCGAIGAVRSVDLAVPAPGDRPTSIAFVGSAATFAVAPKDFRASLGPNVVRSAFVRSAQLDGGGESLVLDGTGRGHGVGLCQWGARALALGGTSEREILAFYLRGTALGRI